MLLWCFLLLLKGMGCFSMPFSHSERLSRANGLSSDRCFKLFRQVRVWSTWVEKSQPLLPLKLLDCLWSALLFSHIFKPFVFSPLVSNWVNNTVYYYGNKILQTLHLKVSTYLNWVTGPYTFFLARTGPIHWFITSTVTTNDWFMLFVKHSFSSYTHIYIFSYEYNVLEEGRCR